MPRRPKRNPYRAYWIDWSPEIAEAFGSLRLLCAGMPDPKRVRVYPGKRSVTLVAPFADENGRQVRLTMKERW